jgi:hypothetical protein
VSSLARYKSDEHEGAKFGNSARLGRNNGIFGESKYPRATGVHFGFRDSAAARRGGGLSFPVSCDGNYQIWQVKFFRANSAIPAARFI